MTFPDNISNRESYILDQIKIGNFELNWKSINYTEKDNTITIDVQTDALKIDGIRINVSASLSQKIADMTGAMLLTPKIADIIYLNSDFKIGPNPRPITLSTQAMIEHSKKIDNALNKFIDKKPTEDSIIDTVGKYWCISNKLQGSKTKALNYGWHFEGSSYQGISGFKCASGMPYKVIQPAATAHDYNHVDYSQIHRAVAEVCKINGEQKLLKDVLTDPKLAYLVSHEGPLNVIRQPSVQEQSEKIIFMPAIKITI